MNQSLLFNDDLYFDATLSKWIWSAIYGGAKINIEIQSSLTTETFNSKTQFDWEMYIEEWLEEHDLYEVDADGVHLITFTFK